MEETESPIEMFQNEAGEIIDEYELMDLLDRCLMLCENATEEKRLKITYGERLLEII
jgi:hypothetical protein